MIRNYLRRAYRTLLPAVYARSDFKLLLKTSILSVDARVRQLAVATDLFANVLRPIPIRAPFGRSMLVLAPHQDDEIIGCGGALALQVGAKRDAHILLLQDGGNEHEAAGMSRPDLVALRNRESERAAAAIGAEPPRFLGYPDLRAASRAAAEEIRASVVERKVDAVFVPFILDSHPDHRMTNYILADALRGLDGKVRVFGYEVWSLCIPNVILPIDEEIERKLDALSCFEYANQAVDYLQSTKGLNMYHSRKLGAGICKHAECFFEAPREEYIALVDQLREAEFPTATTTGGG
jgi:LmbE family N-acetylglucosaminyl deacetylase